MFGMSIVSVPEVFTATDISDWSGGFAYQMITFFLLSSMEMNQLLAP
jgi:hypothetical protein